jgi:hypothetical protein
MYHKSLTTLFVETILDSYRTDGGCVAGHLRAQERRRIIRTDTRCLCINPANLPHNKRRRQLIPSDRMDAPAQAMKSVLT